MAKPHPSLTLVLDLDERCATEETRLEIGRCYTHVATALIRTHAPLADKPENALRMLVKLGQRAYLSSSAEGADELWTDVMERWLRNEFYNVSNLMLIYNRRQVEEGKEPLYFDWLEVELENGALIVRMRLDSASSIPAAQSAMLSRVRDALNANALGEGVTRVSMPTDASYEAQCEAGLAAKAQREAARAEEAAQREAEEKAAAAAAEKEAEESFLESPALVAERDTGAQAAAGANEAETDEPYGLEEPDFALEYSLWSIEYADGAVRAFDSSTSAFID